MSSTRTIGFFGSFLTRNYSSSLAKAQYMENCYPEKTENPLSGKVLVNLLKRPGSSVTGDSAAGNLASLGACIWYSNSATTPPTVFSFTNGAATEVRIYTYDDSSITLVGAAIPTSAQCKSITDTIIGTTGNLVANTVTTGGSPVDQFWFFPQGGAWTQITDVDFPLNQTPALLTVGPAVHMDGYMFVLTSKGLLYNSNLNSLSAWTSTNFITAGNSPDGGAQLVRYKDMIVVFGLGTIEFYKNVGSASGSPLQRINGAALDVGAVPNTIQALATVKNIGETVYWIGPAQASGAYGVYRFNGMQAEKISNAAIDKILNNGSGAITQKSVSGIIGSLNLHGMTHVVFGNGAGDPYYYNHCYCVETNTWWQLNTSAAYPNYLGVCIGYKGFSYFTNTSSAKIGTFDYALFKDNAVAYTETFQTAPLDEDTTNLKTVNRLRIIGDTQSATSNLGVQYSDDDQVSYSAAQNIDLSVKAKELTGLGSYQYNRSWKFTHSANTDCRLRAFELLIDKGTS